MSDFPCPHERAVEMISAPCRCDDASQRCKYEGPDPAACPTVHDKKMQTFSKGRLMVDLENPVEQFTFGEGQMVTMRAKLHCHVEGCRWPEPCPGDTDGDGGCGFRSCPHCGVAGHAGCGLQRIAGATMTLNRSWEMGCGRVRELVAQAHAWSQSEGERRSREAGDGAGG